jgi:hypothetical protein
MVTRKVGNLNACAWECNDEFTNCLNNSKGTRDGWLNSFLSDQISAQ